MITKKITEFKHIFNIPDKDFKKDIDTELIIHVYLKKNDEGREEIFFQVTIPKYIYEKVLNTGTI